MSSCGRSLGTLDLWTGYSVPHAVPRQMVGSLRVRSVGGHLGRTDSTLKIAMLGRRRSARLNRCLEYIRDTQDD
jgi:hypothetical protein